ncbi:T9SS type A sorting domain-containing protein [Saccharicrinis sp. FJH62]|uniref:T9SS type A sorting domain-containing protein n=1 Tax=Saccharicrinis sp. FJH62 TaxID=3344657 RepID=UPI0035D3F2A8
MKRYYTIFSCIIFLCTFSYGTVINVPADSSTIQAAINGANEGDTILVAEGTYYENINYNGKAITVTSHFIMDGDTSHISKTIIDGSQPSHPDSASVVRLMADQDTTSVLCGFTLTGGKGMRYNNQGTYVMAGGGIVIFQGAKIENNIIHGNEVISDNLLSLGGGIVAKSEGNDVVIRNNIIRDNVCTTGGQAQGGGINLIGDNNKFIVENNTIKNNKTQCTDPSTNNYLSAGAGLLYVSSDPKNCTLIFKGNKILGNTSTGNLSRGGGVYIELLKFTASQNGLLPYIDISNNIISNNSAGQYGGGLYFDEDNNYYYSRNPMPLVINNTIMGNSASVGREIYNSGLKLLLMNNIIWNDYTPMFATNNGKYEARYNVIKKGYTGEGNIDSDPMLDPETFALTETSPCIGKGAYSVKIDTKWYPVPILDYLDLPRPNAVDQWTDMGAIESEFARPDDPTLIKVPTEITTIQAAINASNEGDTVLVAEGTYFENIDYKGKAITVASQFIEDGDTSHISKTIIDGSQPSHPDTASVVRFLADEDTTSVLNGFTITGGKGIRYYANGSYFRTGGGIFSIHGAKIINNIISNNELTVGSISTFGAGIACNSNYGNLIIRNNLIKENKSNTGLYSQGGGIGVHGTGYFYLIENNSIINNSAMSTANSTTAGGGIFCSSENPKNAILILRNNRIIDNETTGTNSSGGGLFYLINPFTEAQNGLVPNAEIYNNIVSGNKALRRGGGFLFIDTNSAYSDLAEPAIKVINNTIVNNTAPAGREIYNEAFKILLVNNIIWNDLTPLFATNKGTYQAWNNCIKGGYQSEFGNIDTEPLLDSLTFELGTGSPCIDAGIDSVEVGGLWYYAPIRDFRDSIRPKPVNTNPDIGAIESSRPWDGIRQTRLLDVFVLIYPNPASDILQIEVLKAEQFNIQIISLKGQSVFETKMDKPEKEIDVSNLKAGMYLIRISSKDKIVTEKLIKL